MYKHKETILVVDDNPISSKMLAQILQSDYSVIIANDGRTALSLAENSIPDIILLDVLMPEMDGIEVCKKLKHNVKTRNIPVIFITSLSEEEDEQRGLEVGAIDYITKPYREAIIKIRIKNILEIKRNRDILEKLSYVDHLTGIYNRRFFDEYFNQEWNRALNDKKLLSLIMIDIDCFKEYNDHYGHIAGDECIRKIALTIEGAINKNSNFVARYGGDEFACVVTGMSLDDIRLIATKITEAVSQANIKNEFSKISDIVTLSVGVGSIFPKQSHPPLSFIKKVDELLYTSKNNGRNQIQANYIVIDNE